MHNFWGTKTEKYFHMLVCLKLEIQLNSHFETKTQKMILQHFNLLTIYVISSQVYKPK